MLFEVCQKRFRKYDESLSLSLSLVGEFAFNGVYNVFHDESGTCIRNTIDARQEGVSKGRALKRWRLHGENDGGIRASLFASLTCPSCER